MAACRAAARVRAARHPPPPLRPPPLSGHESPAPNWHSSHPPTHPPPPQEEDFCDEFHLVDLRVNDNCKKVAAGCDQVFNLAADMGGMG